MKKLLLFVLLVITLSCRAYAQPDVSFGDAEFLCTPIESTQVNHAAFGTLNGDDIMYTSTSGSPAVFNVYNLDKNTLLASYELPGTKNIWNHIVNVDGCIYINGGGHLFRYNPYSDYFEDLGSISDDGNDSFLATNDEYGNIYMGTTKYAKIIKYDYDSQTFIDLGSVVSGATYVRSINYHNGYLYCGVKGDSLVGLYRVNVNNPSDIAEIPLPESGDYTKELMDSVTWVYSATVIDDKIAFYVHAEGKYLLLVYDTVNEKFVETGFSNSFKGIYCSPVKDGKSYFISGGYLYYLDIATGKASKLNFNIGSDSFYGVGWVTMANNGLYGEFLVCIDHSTGQPIYYDVENLIRYKTPIEVSLKKANYTIQSIEFGDRANGDDGLYIGSYAGSSSARYNTDTGEITAFPSAQIEGMIGYNGKQYMGTYTKAYLYEFDYTKAVGSSNPKNIGRIAENQDRPFAVTAGDGKVYAGTIPDYGLRGGAIGEYDIQSGTLTSHGVIFEDQSIMSLVYKDGLLYGSTTVWGGLGAEVTADAAKIFVYNPETKKIVSQFTPTVNGNSKPLWIGGLAFDKNGTLWAASGGSLFSVNVSSDKSALSVANEFDFIDYTYSTTTHQWRPLYIRFDDKGRLYVNINTIQVVDVDTLEYISLADKLNYKKVHLYDLDEYGNIYYAQLSSLYILPVNVLKSELKLPEKQYVNFITMSSDEKINAENGEYTLISGNKYIVAYGTVPEYTGWEISEYGIEINGIKYKSQSKLKYDMFGIILDGVKEKEYSAKTYAVYTDGKEAVTVYSNGITVE